VKQVQEPDCTGEGRLLVQDPDLANKHANAFKKQYDGPPKLQVNNVSCLAEQLNYAKSGVRVS